VPFVVKFRYRIYYKSSFHMENTVEGNCAFADEGHLPQMRAIYHRIGNVNAILIFM
jgi:hypothetical protein